MTLPPRRAAAAAAMILMIAAPAAADERPLTYSAYIALQALDVHSTHRALAGGAREMNPLMRGSDGKRVAIKAATTAVTLGLVHVVHRKNPVAGRILLGALAGTAAAIVVHNYRQVHRR